MKNNDNISSDLEVGMAVEGTAAVNSPPPENPSTTGSLAGPAAPKFKNLIRMVLSRIFPIFNLNRTVHAKHSRIFGSFNLTKTTTQQKALVLLCVAGTIVDPLFFYIPMINEGSKCMKSDWKLGVIAISLRSLVDVLHFVQWSFYYENKWSNFSASTSAATATSKEISSGNTSSFSPRNSKATGRLIEILCILPLPQAAALAILIIKGCPRSQQAVTLLKFSVLSQFVLRALRVFPSFHEAKTNSVTLLKRRFWIGAGFNLLLFVIASHVLGAFWYLLSVGRMMDCWKSACRRRVGCNIDSLYCGGPTDNKTYLKDYCPIQQATNSSAFNFGIYLSALDSNIVGSTRFPLKLSYCFWWGLQNLSSLGQNLTTSAYEWEIMFSICISILGLILFSLFIGNMQAFFQYRTNEDLVIMKDKMDKIEKKQRELLKWELFQWLPKDLQDEIILCTNDIWLKTTEVNLQTTLDYLPIDLGKRIKDTIFSELQLKVRLFRALNTQALGMFNYVKPEVFAKESLVFEKGHPIKHMVFVLNGKLRKQIDPDGSMAQDLQVWDFCGEELLIEILRCSQKHQLTENCPTSTVDIKACTKVEAFILDVKYLQTLLNESSAAIQTARAAIYEIWMSIVEHKRVSFIEHERAREDATKKQKKAAEEKPSGLTRWASFEGKNRSVERAPATRACA